MLITLEGVRFQHYTIQRLLKRGGMSAVYLALDDEGQQPVAIKMVHDSHAENSERFQREIQLARSLDHPHILPVLDSGTYGEWHYMVMPYIEHGTLQERIERGLLTPEEASPLLEQVADALQYAHDKGIIHRDIKPTNVLLRDDSYAYLTDFGVAKARDEDFSLTRTGAMIGTPKYMAPELAFEPATPLSDIYSLGVLLYQMLTGRVPFDGVTPLDTMQKHLQEPPLLPSRLNSAIPHSVDQVILLALHKDPQLRFQSPTALVQAYNASLMTVSMIPVASARVVVHPVNSMHPPSAPSRLQHLRLPAALLVSIAVLVILFGAMLIYIPLAAQRAAITGSTRPPVHSAVTVTPHVTTTSVKVTPALQPTATPVPQQSGGSSGHRHGHGHGHDH